MSVMQSCPLEVLVKNDHILAPQCKKNRWDGNEDNVGIMEIKLNWTRDSEIVPVDTADHSLFTPVYKLII